MRFVCKRKCQHNGVIWQVGQILESEVIPPIHFVSLDAEIADKTVKKEETISEIEAVKAELTGLGVVFDKRWGLTKLKNELLNAKKTRGK